MLACSCLMVLIGGPVVIREQGHLIGRALFGDFECIDPSCSQARALRAIGASGHVYFVGASFDWRASD